MKINEKTYSWSGNLSKRAKTDYIILHHAASSVCSPEQIHSVHLKNGWAGIGYHFYVRKDGTIYRGRPINTVGAQASGYNSRSVGVCFEGNFETEKMSESQIRSGNEIVKYLKETYPRAKVIRHKDVNATACPGKNFPFDEITKAEISDVNDIVLSLNKRNIMTDKALWLKKCANKSNSYWLAYKICNMTKNIPERVRKIDTVNDIVWELNHQGIITDKALWLKLFNEDKDLYWLGYKAVNMTENI